MLGKNDDERAIEAAVQEFTTRLKPYGPLPSIADEALKAAVSKALEAFCAGYFGPSAEIADDAHGQIIVYTGMKYAEDGETWIPMTAEDYE